MCNYKPKVTNLWLYYTKELQMNRVKPLFLFIIKHIFKIFKQKPKAYFLMMMIIFVRNILIVLIHLCILSSRAETAIRSTKSLFIPDQKYEPSCVYSTMITTIGSKYNQQTKITITWKLNNENQKKNIYSPLNLLS